MLPLNPSREIYRGCKVTNHQGERQTQWTAERRWKQGATHPPPRFLLPREIIKIQAVKKKLQSTPATSVCSAFLAPSPSYGVSSSFPARSDGMSHNISFGGAVAAQAIGFLLRPRPPTWILRPSLANQIQARGQFCSIDMHNI
ncbi:hypothetical protein Nepgr_024080 [Nepenthes gracilis]|uniref:Uncharacterized protein n=1 Tax=Nepenthes gracilis TaxID=150966 RepID=A0AAD3T3Z7_NEPGR|nr:hypothetical protein Nepgr_024080 [Nepenthes gracilis]